MGGAEDVDPHHLVRVVDEQHRPRDAAAVDDRAEAVLAKQAVNPLGLRNVAEHGLEPGLSVGRDHVEAEDGAPLGGQDRGERLAEEAGRAGDEDLL